MPGPMIRTFANHRTKHGAIHRNTNDATVDIATVSNNATSECRITLGGAWATQADATSYTKIGTFYTGVADNLEIGTG